MTDIQTPNLEELVQEREWRRVAPNWRTATDEQKVEAFKYFCAEYWWIRHPERGRIKFDLFDSQVEAVALWILERYTVALKARQIGFSTLISTFTFWLTYFYSDRAIVMLSKTERDAVKLLDKAKYGSRFLPDWMKYRGPVVQINQTRMTMSNESYLESLPSASDPARGESVYTVVVDELGLLPNSEEAWAAIEPIADVGGRVIMLGTAHGEGNLFHKLWVGSQTGANRFKGIFFPWWSGDRDDAWYETKRRDLPDWQLAQEYPSDPDEAFLRSGHPVFNVEALKALQPAMPIRGNLAYQAGDGFAFEPHENGPLRIWEEPAAAGRYVIGADVAEGLEHGDYSCAHVVDAKTKQVVATFHARIEPDIFGSEILFNLARWYNQALLGVESNNHGLTTNRALIRMGYTPLYKRRSLTKARGVQPTETLGWQTTAISKPLAVDELNKAIRDGELHVLDVETHAELRTYIREGDGKMHGSPHDDRVMALAIAVQMLKYVWLREYQPVREPPPGTFGYMEKLLFGRAAEMNKPKDRDPIGIHYIRSTR